MTILGSPAYLHDARRDYHRLVVPAPLVNLEGAAHALERVRVAARLQPIARYLQVFTHVVRIQYHVYV